MYAWDVRLECLKPRRAHGNGLLYDNVEGPEESVRESPCRLVSRDPFPIEVFTPNVAVR